MREDQFLFRISFDPELQPFRPPAKKGHCLLCGFPKDEGEHLQWYDYGTDGPWWGCRVNAICDTPQYLGTIHA